MIISDKILYLRKKVGYTQEELAQKLNVSRQSISKWESAQSIPDVTKIMEMAKLFSVSTDYLLKDEIEKIDGETTSDTDDTIQVLTIENANEFIFLKERSLKIIGLAVSLFIASAITLICFTTLMEDENIGVAMGLIGLFVLVVIGVSLCIWAGYITSEYKFIEDRNFRLSNNVEGIIKEKKNVFKPTRIKNLIICISLIILSVLPLIVMSTLTQNDKVIILALCFLLLVVALSVPQIIIVVGKWECYQSLLFEGEYKKGNETYEAITSIYWSITLVIYLAWSFLTNDWHITWIVWPIAGILSSFLNLFKINKQS